MLKANSKPSEIPCQPLFENQFNFNEENRLLADCGEYCVTIVQKKDSPWQRHANLMAYWYGHKQTKISKLQKNLLHYLHQWYFSKGLPAYLKTRNLAKHLKTSRRAIQRTVTRLVNRGILIRLEYWSDKYQRFRSILLPDIHKTVNEKLVFQLEKRSDKLFNTYLNNLQQNQVSKEQTVPPPLETVAPSETVASLPSETVAGGCDRYFGNPPKSLRIQKGNIYTNILYNNYCSNNYCFNKKLSKLNLPAAVHRPAQEDLGNKKFLPINQSNAEETKNMQTKLKPQRIMLKVQGEFAYPPSIDESINILRKKDFNIKSLPQVAISDLLYYVENKIFMNDDHNNPDIQSPDLNSIFKLRMFNQSDFVEQYDSKLFKMLMQLFADGVSFNNKSLIIASKKIIGFWSGCARNNKNKSVKFTNHNPNLKSKIGFKIYIGILYHLHYTLNYDTNISSERYEDKFIKGIQRFFNYAYALTLPKKVSFDIALVDHNDSNRFLNCLELEDDDFVAFINSSKRLYQARPETERSLGNFKQIFTEGFYAKDKEEGSKRFEQFKPRFSRFLEVLIGRIEKYSVNGKRVELSGLKLTAETPQDVPVLYYYMEWLKINIFNETVFSFDEMFSLNNWTMFIKNYMRNERGYSNYWKIVDTK